MVSRTKDGPSSLHTTVSVPRAVRALASVDLDSHVSFIRRSLAQGKSSRWIGEQLGVKYGRINNYARKHRMVKNGPNTSQRCTPSHKIPFGDVINTLSFRPRPK